MRNQKLTKSLTFVVICFQISIFAESYTPDCEQAEDRAQL